MCVCVCVLESTRAWFAAARGMGRVGTAGDRGSGILGLSVKGIVLFIDLIYFR